MQGNSPWRDCFLGTNNRIKTKLGWRPRIFFNNGATPLVAKTVQSSIQELFPCFTYINELNYNSRFITEQYASVRETIAKIVGVDQRKDQILFTRTATEGLNLMAYLYQQLYPESIVITTCMEHMANYLPFIMRMNTKVVLLDDNGHLDLDQYEALLKKYKGKVSLVTVTAASNVTGYVPPYYEMARLAHKYGAKILVDAVQAVQHMPFSVHSDNEEDHLDFVVFAGHKCYTGLGGAALIGPKKFFSKKVLPILYGAGVNRYTDLKRVILEKPPALFEAGYLDIAGIICFGKVLEFLMSCKLELIESYECRLRRYLIKRLETVPGIRIYGPKKMEKSIPYVSFGREDWDYRKLGELLGYTYGIGVAAGVAGADVYTGMLLGKTSDELYDMYQDGISYGLVRVSMGMFNSPYEIDCLIKVLLEISERDDWKE
ncbi:MAG: aminotransferase class V-fold PLP-dependent enzyme [Lachnospiraceae bacterium]|nr:aminotransferase class V-fold PLP-dependent enzyme [Lachnospiraceae bacterium]